MQGVPCRPFKTLVSPVACSVQLYSGVAIIATLQSSLWSRQNRTRDGSNGVMPVDWPPVPVGPGTVLSRYTVAYAALPFRVDSRCLVFAYSGSASRLGACRQPAVYPEDRTIRPESNLPGVPWKVSDAATPVIPRPASVLQQCAKP